jgi:hypothetical protein
MGFNSSVVERDGFRVSVMSGNTKLGHIDNVSLTPGATCGRDVPCRGTCYAMKAFRQYQEVRTAWQENEKAVRGAPAVFFAVVDEYLIKHRPEFFRIHVAGDFIDRDYLSAWYRLSRQHPETSFLAFTKRYDLLSVRGRPANFQMVVSAWPGFKLPRTKLPIAYMQDGTETRVKNAIRCPGFCHDCGMCFQLSSIKKNVVFHVH